MITPRLRARLKLSKNIILFLSSSTISSRALREELDYGINQQKLPVIVIYPEYKTKESLLNDGALKKTVRTLWGKIPVFRDSMLHVPTLHIPMDQTLIRAALGDSDFKLATKTKADIYHYPV